MIGVTQAREDVTSTYLTDANLEDEAANWALVSSGGNHNWNTNKYHESWNNTFTITQTTSALPAGYYQLSIQVAGNNSTTASLQATSGSNSSIVAYPKYSIHGNNFGNVAAWCGTDANHTGNSNLNRIFTTVYVEEGQTLTATFKQTANNKWIIYGRVQLHKLTDDEGRYAQAFEAAYNSQTNLDMASGRFKQRFEYYKGGDVSKLTGKTLTKTIPNLPRGKYNVTLNGGASYANNDGVSGGGTGDNKTEFFANNVSANVTVVQRTNIGNEEFTDYSVSNVLVTDGNLEIGFNNKASGANWFVGSVKYIELADPYVSVMATKSFTSGGTMEAEQWYTFTVPTDGDYTLSATEGIKYAVEDKLVSEAGAATSTVALKAGTAYFKSSTSQTLTISYVEPVIANGDYYLYDATNKVFLSRGANFGSRATVDKYGVPFTWNNYSKTIVFKDWTTKELFFDQTNHTACWLYTDQSNKGIHGQFSFEEKEGSEGYYYLCDKEKAAYITHDNAVLTVPSATSSGAAVWQVLTKAERDAIVNAYPTDNKTNVIVAASLTSETDASGFEAWLAANRAAKDYTSHVGTAKFAGNKGDWTWTKNPNGKNDATYGTDWTEAFQEAVGTWSQTISDLPKGVYKVTVNAFERAAAYADCNTLGDAGWQPVTAYFKANEEQISLKSWYSEKEGTSNPDNTTQAATAFNNDKYKNQLYAYVGDDGKLTISVAKPGKADGSWVLFNNVTLTYYDENVSDEDATAILDEATTTMGSPMKASLYQALSSAKTTFDGARSVPNYNALRDAIDNTATSIISYANMYTNYLSPLAIYFATTNYVQSDAYNTYLGYKDAYDNYTDAETADVENAVANSLSITQGGGTNYTSTYSLMMLPNWTKNGTAALSNSGFYVNTWSTENKGTGDAKDFANPFYEYWVGSGSLAKATIVGTMTGLKANQAYDVTANVRVLGASKVDGSITMEVEGGIPVDVTAGDAIMDGETPTGRYIKSYTATGVTDADGKLELKFNVAANSNISWLSFRDINCAESEAAISNDFTALNSAISSVEGALGFEDGEYAPYNNTAKVAALSTAKALNQGRYYIPSVISDATTTLNNTEWELQNDGELNAFYDGSFSTREVQETSKDGTKIPGWTSGNNIRQILKTEATFPGLADATEKTALFAWSGGAQYGEDTGYEIPLKANTIYRLKFKAAGWNNETRGNITVSVKNGEDGLSATNLGSADKDISTGMTQFEKVFKTGAAGNYVFSISSANNMVITDFELMKATASATMQVSAVAKMGTFCAPFNVKIPSGVKAYTLTEGTNANWVHMNEVSGTTIEAGTPVLLTSDAKVEENFNGQMTVTDPDNSGLLKGVFEKTTVEKDANNYLLQYQDSKCAFYLVKDDEIYIGKNRCYLHVEGATPARIAIGGEEGDPTAISEMKSVEAEAKTMPDGKYLVKGRIVVVKNGKAFGTNGQILK